MNIYIYINKVLHFQHNLFKYRFYQNCRTSSVCIRINITFVGKITSDQDAIYENTLKLMRRSLQSVFVQ